MGCKTLLPSSFSELEWVLQKMRSIALIIFFTLEIEPMSWMERSILPIGICNWDLKSESGKNSSGWIPSKIRSILIGLAIWVMWVIIQKSSFQAINSLWIRMLWEVLKQTLWLARRWTLNSICSIYEAMIHLAIPSWQMLPGEKIKLHLLGNC